MPRTKKYNELEVIEKAMNLFWKNGYENTSMQMLEKEMGINKFSIYSSFGSKHGLFIESLKSYRNKMSFIFKEFEQANNGVEDIKNFFYNTVNAYTQKGFEKGCLYTNTYYEFSDKQDEAVNQNISTFMKNLKELFIKKLSLNTKKDKQTIIKQANYLVLAKHGLAIGARVHTQKEIEDYIELTFKNL